MNIRLFLSIVGIVLISGACTPMFLLSKEGSDKRGRFLGSKTTYEMLCESGDLLKVLEATNFSKEMKETFYQSNCSAERSGDKVRQIYAAMTPDQRKDIRTAFKKNGYLINSGNC